MAARYWVGGNGTWDATAGTKWSLTSGGAGGEAVPTSADDVYFDNADNITTTAAGVNCKSWTCTGYTGTFTLNGSMVIAGNVTLSSGMTITTSSGTPQVDLTATCTFTSNGKTWPYLLRTLNTWTLTLVGDLYVDGNFNVGTGSTINKTTTESLYLSGGLTHNGVIFTGTAEIVLTGGTWSGSAQFRGLLRFAGNVTLSATRQLGSGAVITYTSGTIDVITNDNTLDINASATLNTNGMVWNKINFSGFATTTLTSNLTARGLVTVSASGGHVLNRTTTETLTCQGGIAVNNSISGTAKIILTGGTWSATVNGAFANDFDLQGATGTYTFTVTSANATVGATYTNNGQTFTVVTTIAGGTTLVCTGTGAPSASGTLTKSTGTGDATITFNTFTNIVISGTVYYRTGTLKYVSGTVTFSSAVLTLQVSPEVDTNGLTWTNVSFTSAGTVTLLSNFQMSGVFTITAALVLNRTTAETFTTSGGLTITNSNVDGTAEIILTGGTWSASTIASIVRNNLTFAGNVTIGATVVYGTRLLKYTSGTVDTTTNNSTLYFYTSPELDTNGIIWRNVVAIENTSVLTLVSNFSMTGLFTISNSTTINQTTAETWTTSGGLTVNSSCSGTAKVILTGGTWSGSNTTGIANDLDLQGTITVSGNVYYRTGTLRYVSGTITVTSSNLNITGSCTLNTNGMSWNILSLGATGLTVTLISNCSVQTLTLTGSGQIYVINRTTSETFTTVSISQSNNRLDGTASLNVGGTGGTWTATPALVTTASFTMNTTIVGDLSITSIYTRANTFTYSSGTVTHSGSLWINGSTLNLNGVTWNSVQIPITCTITLTSSFTVSGSTQLTGSGQDIVINKTASETWTSGGASILNNNVSGTADIYFTTGSWSGTYSVGNIGAIRNNLYISGTVTISTTAVYKDRTLYYNGGSISGTGTLQLTGNCTLNTNGLSFYNVTVGFNNGETYTINSLFTITNILSIGAGVTATFAGLAGFTTHTLSLTGTVAQTINLKESITYTITASFSCYQSRVGSIVLFTSSHASTKANILLPNNGSNLCNVLASFTRINALGGRSITTFGGTITNCDNIVQYYDYPSVAA